MKKYNKKVGRKISIRKPNNRKPNPNLIKIGASYQAEELAIMLKVCKKTVLNWHEEGLSAIDITKPLMFNGVVVKEFITHTNQAKMFKCQAHEFLCLTCKSKRTSINEGLKLVKHISGKYHILHGKCEICTKYLRKTIKTSDAEIYFPNLLNPITTLLSSHYHIPS